MNVIEIRFEVIHHLIIRWHKFGRDSNRRPCTCAKRRQSFLCIVLNGDFRFRPILSLLPNIWCFEKKKKKISVFDPSEHLIGEGHHTYTSLINLQLTKYLTEVFRSGLVVLEKQAIIWSLQRLLLCLGRREHLRLLVVVLRLCDGRRPDITINTRLGVRGGHELGEHAHSIIVRLKAPHRNLATITKSLMHGESMVRGLLCTRCT